LDKYDKKIKRKLLKTIAFGFQRQERMPPLHVHHALRVIGEKPPDKSPPVKGPPVKS